MNCSTHQRPATAGRRDRSGAYSSPELALIVYAFLAAFTPAAIDNCLRKIAGIQDTADPSLCSFRV